MSHQYRAESPYDEVLDRHMCELRKLAKDASRDGLDVVVIAGYNDRFQDDDGIDTSRADYAVFGNTYASIGLMRVTLNECERGLAIS